MAHLLFWATLLLPLLVSTSFQDPFTPTKWHGLHLVALVLPMFLRKRIEVPHVERVGTYAWVVLGICSIYSICILRGEAFVTPLLDRLSFLILFLGFLQIPSEKIHKANLISSLLVVGYLLFQVAGVDFLKIQFGTRPNSTFGNPNMLAQFLGISVMVQAAHKFRFKALYIGAMIGVIFYLGNRSAFLATMLGFGIIFLSQLRPFTKKKALISLQYLGAAVLTALFLSTAPHETIVDKQTKESSATAPVQSTLSIRKELWRSSWEIWKKNPLGIGAGNYEFQDVYERIGGPLPNVEFITYNNPHNEFVRYAVEEGVVFVLALLVFIASVYVWPLRTVAPFWGTLVFFGVEAFFQFPFQNPMGLYFLAYFAALWIPAVKTVRTFHWEYAVALVIGVLFYRDIKASYLVHNKEKDLASMTEACALNPGNWRACTLLAMAQRDSGRYLAADKSFYALYNRYPAMYPAMRHHIFNHFKMNRTYDACYLMWKYNKILDQNSSLKAAYDIYCKQLTPHFEETYAATWKTSETH